MRAKINKKHEVFCLFFFFLNQFILEENDKYFRSYVASPECLDPWDYLALTLDVVTSPCPQSRNVVVLGRLSTSAQTYETSEYNVSSGPQVREVSH